MSSSSSSSSSTFSPTSPNTVTSGLSARDHYSLARYLRHHSSEPGIPDNVVNDVNEWLRETDFHNNYGCDFLDITQSADFKESIDLVLSSPFHMQTGTGADDRTMANLVWDHLHDVCKSLFCRKTSTCADPEHLYYFPLSVAEHGCDLISHIITVAHLFYSNSGSESGHEITNELPLGSSIKLIIFPRSYFSRAFVPPTQSVRYGRQAKIYEVKTDPSIDLNQHYSQAGEDLKLESDIDRDAREGAALKQIRDAFLDAHNNKEKCVVLFEPLLIPGGGYTYSATFMQKLKILCGSFGTILAVDETLSFVRCGHPLFSLSVGFEPDLVLIGKGLGANLLLCSSKFHERHKMKHQNGAFGVLDLSLEMQMGFSMIASPLALVQIDISLRMILRNRVSQRCQEQGKRLLDYFINHPRIGRTRVKGFGYVLWLNHDALEQFAISASPNGRLLPRIDQSVATFQSIERFQVTKFQNFQQKCSKAADLAKPFSCARCGTPITVLLKQQPVISCDSCSRQYHEDCKREVPNHQCPCKRTELQPSASSTQSQI